MDNAEMTAVVSNAWRVASTGIRDRILEKVRNPSFCVPASISPSESIGLLLDDEANRAFDTALVTIREHFGDLVARKYALEIETALEDVMADETHPIISEAVELVPWLVPGSASD